MYKFNEKLSDKIVDGIYNGYMTYVEKRIELNQEMYISDAYTFMKSNHIEDEVIKRTVGYAEYLKESAGPAWKYIQFKTKEAGDEQLFMIKNERYFDPKNVTKGKDINSKTNDKSRQYLKEYISSNEDIDIDDLLIIDNKSNQLVLNLKDVENSSVIDLKDIKQKTAYIITYNIDSFSKMIDAVKIWLPLPNEDSAVMVQDLTEKLRTAATVSPYTGITEEHRNLLQDVESEFEIDATLFDIRLDTDEEEEQKN